MSTTEAVGKIPTTKAGILLIALAVGKLQTSLVVGNLPTTLMGGRLINDY